MTELEKLVEKDAIRDQYYVYARALDRIDNPLGKTVFAEDAQVDYGPTYKGTGYGFIDMMLKMHRKMVSTHHVMTNILIKLNEDGTKGASAGFCAIHLLNSLSTGGFQIQSGDKAKAQFAFEFTGHYSMDNPETVPFEIYVKAGTEVAA